MVDFLIKVGTIQTNISCTGTAYNTATVTVTLGVVMANTIYQVLIGDVGSSGRLQSADFRLVADTYTLSSFNIDIVSLGNSCSGSNNIYYLSVLVISSAYSFQFIIDNNLQITSTSGKQQVIQAIHLVCRDLLHNQILLYMHLLLR
jgi:hypothetical protein